MTKIIDQRKDQAPIEVSELTINITIINNSVMKVNGKYLIRTSGNDWMRQDAVWLPQEIDAAKHIIKQLNAQRND